MIPQILSKRGAYIDALRGTAVILMVQQHLGKWLWNNPWNDIRSQLSRYPLLIGFNALGGLAAPIFIVLAGVGTVYFINKNSGTKCVLFIRGLCIIGFGYLLNVITPGWFTWGSWYVLHLIGFSILLSPLVLRHNSITVLAIGFFALFIAPLGQEILQTPYKLYNHAMGDTTLPGGVLRLMFFEGHFPIFPWFGLFCFGIVTGKLLINRQTRFCLALGGLFLVLGALFPAMNSLILHVSKDHTLYRFVALTSRIYPPFPPLLLLLSAAVVFLLIFYRYMENKNVFNERSAITLLGRCSLTLLIVHVFLFRQMAQWLDVYKLFSAFGTGFLISGVILLFGVIAKFWSKVDFALGAEWSIRKWVQAGRNDSPGEK
ncbi:MAG: DUF418 domain-containing transporter [Chitinivibrionales bacterium]|nr:DUF418 domain-containing transporter [Chitinivibrionales bacterium]